MVRLVPSVLLVVAHAFSNDPVAGKNPRWGSALPMAQNDDCVTTADVLSLDSIRSTLIRQEETIIFALIERAQFRWNHKIYVKGAFGDLGNPVGSTPPHDHDAPLSFLEYMLIGTVRSITFYIRSKNHPTPITLYYSQYHRYYRKPCTAESEDTPLRKNMRFSLTDYLRDYSFQN